MTLLTAMGLASVAFVAVFTARAYRDNTAGNGQSRRSAIIRIPEKPRHSCRGGRGRRRRCRMYFLRMMCA